MAAVKEFYYEIAELAFKLEKSLPNREQAYAAWDNRKEECVKEFGVEVTTLFWDIYDEVADRSGDFWELFAGDQTEEELTAIYKRAVA